jgi:NTE family protein
MHKIGLALGGGGAKGYAHVGVLRALEQLNIYADIITGTSMGGIIGGLYAAGLSVDRIELIIRQTGLTVLAAREPSHLGMFGKAKFNQALRKALGNVTFEELSRKFAVVAVDLEAETEVILDTGDVVKALLATSAFPGLFAPEYCDGRYLIDGGALNNVPFDVARHLGADYVIASNVSSHRGPLFHDPPPSGPAQSLVRQLLLRTGAATLWEVVERTVSVMQDQGLKEKLAVCPPDVMLCPEVGHVNLFDVRQLDGCLEAGEAAVYAHAAELVRLRNGTAHSPAPQMIGWPILSSIWSNLRKLITTHPGVRSN